MNSALGCSAKLCNLFVCITAAWKLPRTLSSNALYSSHHSRQNVVRGPLLEFFAQAKSKETYGKHRGHPNNRGRHPFVQASDSLEDTERERITGFPASLHMRMGVGWNVDHLRYQRQTRQPLRPSDWCGQVRHGTSFGAIHLTKTYHLEAREEETRCDLHAPTEENANGHHGEPKDLSSTLYNKMPPSCLADYNASKLQVSNN